MMMIDDAQLIESHCTESHCTESHCTESHCTESATNRSEEPANTPEEQSIPVIVIAPAPVSGIERLQRAKPAVIGLCVVLGVTLAPVLAILGCVGLALPTSTLLHQAATLLLCVAVVGLGLALVMAHIAREELEAAENQSGTRRNTRRA